MSIGLSKEHQVMVNIDTLELCISKMLDKLLVKSSQSCKVQMDLDKGSMIFLFNL